MNDLLNIGIRGLLAFQSALSVTGQNIANVKTPYYSRREIDFAEDLFGNGVNIADVQRVYDATTSQFLQQANSTFSMSDTFYQQVSQLESLLGNQVFKDSEGNERTNNIATFISDAIAALKSLDGDTTSIQSRTVYLNKLMALANRISTIGTQIEQQGSNINQSIQTTVGSVNEITQQIAQINQQIANSQGQDNGALLDKREVLVQQLSQYVNFSTQTDSSGQMNILIDDGTPLVFGSKAETISAVPDPNDPSNLILNMTSGVSTMNITNLIHGGQIAGYFNAQTVLEQAQNALGRLSLGIMQTFNAQNKLGIDYNGNLGGNIFNDINSASAMSQRVLPNSNNTGTENMNVTISDVTQLTTSDYILVFDTPTHYTMTRLSDKTVVGSGSISSLPQQISADGFTININSGTIATGDKFTISPTRGASENMGVAISDPKLLALGWPVSANSNPLNQGNGTINVDNILDTTNSAFSLPKQLNPPITIKFLSPTTYELINANTSAVMEGPITYTPGAPVFPTPGGYDPGYRISISGSNIQAGDTFDIKYNTNNGDNRNGNIMESQYKNGILQGNSLSFTQGYNLMSSDISIQVNGASADYTSSKVLRDGAYKQYSQVSGVDIGEETTNLAMYQECLQASAQIIQTAKSIFDTIIGLGRN
jgi:flagellar hook-associated protein 1 FlgK